MRRQLLPLGSHRKQEEAFGCSAQCVACRFLLLEGLATSRLLYELNYTWRDREGHELTKWHCKEFDLATLAGALAGGCGDVGPAFHQEDTVQNPTSLKHGVGEMHASFKSKPIKVGYRRGCRAASSFDCAVRGVERFWEGLLVSQAPEVKGKEY